MDDLPESVDLEPVRRDQPVEYAGRVQKLGFREGLLVAAGLLVVLAGAGIVAIGAPPPKASPSLPAAALGSPSPSEHPSATPTPLASPSPSPSPAGPTPAATPSIVCDTRPTTEPPFVNLITRTTRAVGANASTKWLAKPAPISEAPATPVELGDDPVLSVNFAACALEWRITYGGTVIEEQTNPTMDPAYARQGYFVFGPVDTRSARLQLDLHYPAGWSSTAWQLNVDSWPILSADGVAGDQIVEAVPGCGFAVEIGGIAGGETCTSSIVPSSIATIYVAPSTTLAFRVAQSIFTAASDGSFGCGHVTGKPKVFSVDPACDAEWFYGPLGDFTIRAPSSPAVYVAEITGCATYTGGQACGPWFLRIDTIHPQPTPEPGAIGD